MYVEPALPRYQLAYPAGGIRIAIPARRNWPMLLFMCFWLCFWAVGESNVAAQLADGGNKGPELFLYAWLFAWTLGGGSVLLTILWQLFGREVVSISDGAIDYRVDVFGLGRTRSYAINQVTQLRAVDFVTGTFNQRAAMRLPFFGAPTGPIAFDYGAETIRMAPSLDEAEARLLLAKLRERLPASVWA